MSRKDIMLVVRGFGFFSDTDSRWHGTVGDGSLGERVGCGGGAGKWIGTSRTVGWLGG